MQICDGLENRFFDMLLVPISACMFTTLVDLGGYNSNLPSLSRGVGLTLHGTWFVQMGFSFYTNAMAQGCSLVGKSRENFTVNCKGHMASHRSKAIVTLQFNGHLALLVIVIVGVYSVFVYKYGLPGDHSNYKPLNAELQQLDHQVQYTLDSDDELALEENASENTNTNSRSVAVEPEKLSLVNGVLFTGGWAKKGLYFETATWIFEKILEKNDAGYHFPLLAVNLGFEIITMIVNKIQIEIEMLQVTGPLDSPNNNTKTRTTTSILSQPISNSTVWSHKSFAVGISCVAQVVLMWVYARRFRLMLFGFGAMASC